MFPVHAHVLPTGKVMIWPGDEGISGNDQQPRSWDPATGKAISPLHAPGYDLFCSGHSFLADGRLFVAGGHIQNGVGLANASIYDPFGPWLERLDWLARHERRALVPYRYSAGERRRSGGLRFH